MNKVRGDVGYIICVGKLVRVIIFILLIYRTWCVMGLDGFVGNIYLFFFFWMTLDGELLSLGFVSVVRSNWFYYHHSIYNNQIALVNTNGNIPSDLSNLQKRRKLIGYFHCI